MAENKLTEKEGTENNGAGEAIDLLACGEFGERITNNDDEKSLSPTYGGQSNKGAIISALVVETKSRVQDIMKEATEA